MITGALRETRGAPRSLRGRGWELQIILDVANSRLQAEQTFGELGGIARANRSCQSDGPIVGLRDLHLVQLGKAGGELAETQLGCRDDGTHVRGGIIECRFQSRPNGRLLLGSPVAAVLAAVKLAEETLVERAVAPAPLPSPLATGIPLTVHLALSRPANERVGVGVATDEALILLIHGSAESRSPRAGSASGPSLAESSSTTPLAKTARSCAPCTKPASSGTAATAEGRPKGG